MPSIRTALSKVTAQTIKGWLTDAGIDFDRKATKSALIGLALQHAGAIPEAIRLAADPPMLPGSAGGAGNEGGDRVGALEASFAAAMDANDSRIDELTATVNRMATLVETLAAGGGNAAATVSTGPTAVPVRGQHGECPPVSVRLAYLDEKLRGEAMAGTMAPEKLAALLPGTSPLASAANDEVEQFALQVGDGGNPVFARTKSTNSQVLTKFIKAISNPVVFSAAWGVYTDLLLHGLRGYNAQTVADAHTALRHHEYWVLERSLDFTWESIMAYHLSVAAERVASGFTCESWYKNVDADTMTRLLVRKDRPSGGRQQAATAGPSRRAAAPAAPSGERSVCNNWNFGSCSNGSCPRLHACKICRASSHKMGECRAGAAK